MKTKKYPNFQDLYSFQDYKKACEAKATFDCGLSPVCLLAPEHHYSVHTNVLKEKSAKYAKLHIRTLKLEYAIQVWMKAVLLSSSNSGSLFYYWWLHYEENETSFKEVKYSKFYYNTTPEEQIEGFWKLLEKIADSGDVKVCEGYSCLNQNDYLSATPNVEFCVVLDREAASNAYKDINDLFEYPYQTAKRTFKWHEVKDLFTQLTLHQLSLVNTKLVHKHHEIDKMLFIACNNLDVEGVELAISRGANVNALDEEGESALQHAVKYFTEKGLFFDISYSEEELQRIKAENYKKCIAIIDILLAHGADIDLFGINGMQPLTCAYFCGSFDMIKFLLEKGANPNYNSFRSDDVFYRLEDSHKCTILKMIGDLLYEEYDDFAMAVEVLIRSHGGRKYEWDYDPKRCLRIGKYYVRMCPTSEQWLFLDNDGWGIGTEDSITIEDAEVNQTIFQLPHIEGLKEWHQDCLHNLKDNDYDWNQWNIRGRALAKEVAKVLPENVALFYPYGGDIEVRWDAFNKKYYIDALSENIWINPNE